MKISDERLADINYTALMGTWSQESPATADEIVDITDELQQHRAEKHERRWRTWKKDGHPPTGRHIVFMNAHVNTESAKSWSLTVAKFRCDYVVPEPGEQEFEGVWFCHDQGGITRETDLMKKFYPFWRPQLTDLPEGE